jgi:hypothetical protein
MEQICEVCGYISLLGAIEKYHTIPVQITKAAGMPESPLIKICLNCHKELDTWYLAKVAEMVYDDKMQRYRYRDPAEMVKEYQSAFNGFINFKKRRKI